MRSAIATVGFAVVCVATPTVAHAQQSAAAEVSDPWEHFNRGLYAVNDGIDHAVFEPVARGYRAVTPQPVRHGIANFLNNLRAPVIFANDLLQGSPRRAGVTAARFGINTTVGILGFFDPAAHVGFARHDSDFGQTLGVWGVGSGPYLFVPLFGPMNVRDGVGHLVDVGLDPLTWAKFHGDDTARVTRAVVGAVSARESVLDSVDDVRRTSIDPYASIRNSYGLLRISAIQNGRGGVQDLPDLQDIPDVPGTAAPTRPTGQQSLNDQSSQSPSLAEPPQAPTSQSGEKP
jgi:phospholipid-binding lipoprotein MlaA